MITEVIIQRLDELIGEYNTPFFNYLLYSYDLSLDECEFIIEELKSDINAGNVVPDNIAKTLEDSFRSRVTSLENQKCYHHISWIRYGHKLYPYPLNPNRIF